MFNIFKNRNNEVAKIQNEIDILKEMKADLKEIKNMNNAFYSVDSYILEDMRKSLQQQEIK